MCRMLSRRPTRSQMRYETLHFLAFAFLIRTASPPLSLCQNPLGTCARAGRYFIRDHCHIIRNTALAVTRRDTPDERNGLGDSRCRRKNTRKPGLSRRCVGLPPPSNSLRGEHKTACTFMQHLCNLFMVRHRTQHVQHAFTNLPCCTLTAGYHIWHCALQNSCVGQSSAWMASIRM